MVAAATGWWIRNDKIDNRVMKNVIYNEKNFEIGVKFNKKSVKGM